MPQDAEQVVVTLHAVVERGDWDHQEMVQIPLGPLADARLAVEALGDALVEMAGKMPRLADAMKAGFHDSPSSPKAPIDRGAIAVEQIVPGGGGDVLK